MRSPSAPLQAPPWVVSAISGSAVEGPQQSPGFLLGSWSDQRFGQIASMWWYVFVVYIYTYIYIHIHIYIYIMNSYVYIYIHISIYIDTDIHPMDPSAVLGSIWGYDLGGILYLLRKSFNPWIYILSIYLYIQIFKYRIWYCVYIQYTFESSIAIERMFLLNYLILCVNDLDTYPHEDPTVRFKAYGFLTTHIVLGVSINICSKTLNSWVPQMHVGQNVNTTKRDTWRYSSLLTHSICQIWLAYINSCKMPQN